jgi:hypothetical protein
MARLQAAWLAGDPAAKASEGITASMRKPAEAHAPVGTGGRASPMRAEQGEAHAPVTGAGAVPAAGALRTESPVAIVGGSGRSSPQPAALDGDEGGIEPHAPVGLTRKQRRRAKWLRRQAGKRR